MRFPVVTARLIVRKAREEDQEAYFQLRNSPYILRYNAMEEASREESDRQVQEDLLSDWAFYLEDRKTGALVGAVWLSKDRLRHGVPSTTLEYFLGESFAGQGLMTEALRSLLPYAFEVLQVEVVSARVFSGNRGSERVLEKLGFVKEGTLRRAVKGYGGIIYDDVVFSLLREEWAGTETLHGKEA